MMLVSRKWRSFPLRTTSGYISQIHLLFSTSAKKATSSSFNPFMAKYLIAACGFPPEEALKISRSARLKGIRSSKKPESVISFLKDKGLDDARIRKSICLYPRILCADTGRSLEPNFRELLENGFEGPEMVRLISASPSALIIRSIGSKIKFWKGLVGTNDRLLKAIKGHPRILTSSISNSVVHNIALLSKYGVIGCEISLLVCNRPNLVTMKTEKLKNLILRVEGLGLYSGNCSIRRFICAFSHLSEESWASKCKLLLSYGFSKNEVLSLIQKNPNVLTLSEANLRVKLDFLMRYVGCEPLYLVGRASLLGHSLMKRLLPRYHLWEVLKSTGLLQTAQDFYTFAILTDKKVLESYILQYRESVLARLHVSGGTEMLPHNADHL